MYPCRRVDIDTDDLASAEVAEEAERDDSEENVRSGEEYEDIAGVAGIEGDGEEARTGCTVLKSMDRRGASILFELCSVDFFLSGQIWRIGAAEGRSVEYLQRREIFCGECDVNNEPGRSSEE